MSRCAYGVWMRAHILLSDEFLNGFWLYWKSHSAKTVQRAFGGGNSGEKSAVSLKCTWSSAWFETKNICFYYSVRFPSLITHILFRLISFFRYSSVFLLTCAHWGLNSLESGNDVIITRPSFQFSSDWGPYNKFSHTDLEGQFLSDALFYSCLSCTIGF